ncbi:Heme d1 biosynthesis protein NirJ [Chitinispirillum alkaliphilum]|nr:Heme d1 biosynthesis protein NirJ [Chitinispirillum alkaliphilum]
MSQLTNLPLRKKVALELYSLKKKAEAQTHELKYLFWECTLKCNLSCVHCGSDCTSDKTIPDMPTKHFLGVLDEIKHSADPAQIMVAITGGEPLMRKDLARTGAQIRKRGFRWGIVTNGYQMDPKIFAELLMSGLSSIAISLDGLEENHDWFRGKKGSFRRAVDAIRLASNIPESKLFFDVVTCVNGRNVRELEKIRNLLIGLGVRNWRLTSIFPKGRACKTPDLKLSPQQLKQLMNFIKATREDGIMDASYGCQGFLGNYEMKTRTKPFHCWAGINIGSVLADGSISACPSLRADYIQGNIYKDDFLQVWDSRYKEMRKREWLKTGKCKNCKVWRYCRGSGLHLRREKTAELLYCEYKELESLDYKE